MGRDRKVTLCCCKSKYENGSVLSPKRLENGHLKLLLYSIQVGGDRQKMRKGKTKMKKSVKETVREAILPTVTELGYRLWDVTYSKIGADYHLEITIDNDKGININDCEKVHRAIDPIIDECDPIEGFYYLDVSSPGAERDLRTDEHIAHCIGWQVEAKLFAPKEGRKSIVGILSAFEDGKISITEGENVIELTQSEVSKLQTIYFED